jgi:hypothetical protein
MHYISCEDSEAARWVVAHLGTLLGGQKDVAIQQIIINTGMPQIRIGRNELEARALAVIKSLPDAQQAWGLLSGYIAEELIKLKDHIALVTEAAEYKRACDVRAAEIALNAEGKQLLGYITTQRQTYDSSLRKLDWLRNPRRPGPRRGPGSSSDAEPAQGQTKTEAEPPAATVAIDTPGVADDAQAAVGLEAACSDCESRVEAIPGFLPLTEADGADGPALELDGESVTAEAPGHGYPMMGLAGESSFTTEPILSDEPPIEPADESFFTTEPNLSNESPDEYGVACRRARWTVHPLPFPAPRTRGNGGGCSRPAWITTKPPLFARDRATGSPPSARRG